MSSLRSSFFWSAVFQSDNGGKFLLEDNWTTFTKARLNCSLPGLYPFYFSELQSTYFELEQHLVYATFTTSPYVLKLEKFLGLSI